MWESPAKRRRLSIPEPELDAGTGTGTVTNHAGRQPTTPTRASYLSPTKSSLSRSHPHLVARNIGLERALLESRGKSLREEILNKVSSGVEAPGTISRDQQLDSRPVNELDPARADENQQDQHLGVLYPEHGTRDVGESPPKLPSPVKAQPPMHSQSSRRRRSSEDTLPPLISPTLVRRGEIKVMERPALPDIEEPELPPTPVALGLSTAPSRPRGLASSSSPRRSLGGGGRLRRRTGAGGSVTSSPLKPRARSPRVAGDEVFTAGHDEVAGSQESEVHVQHEEDLPQGLQEKQATIQALRDQLQQLRRQNERLETLIEKDEEVMAEDLSLLREAYLVPGSLEPDFTNHEAKTLSYLTLFAPSNMRLSYRTDARQIQGRTKAIHYLTIMAPPPWLPGVFEHSFEVVTDTEAVRVEHVRLRDMMTDKPRAKSTMTGITKWIHDRMDDPLHCLDVGGMIWGVGRYFAATIERAKVFRQLHKLNTTASSMMSDPVWEGKDEELGRDQTIELSRWLDKNQLRLPDAASTESSELRAKIMLIWDIGLDWTGHITSNITIAVSGVSIKAEAKLKEVFDGLLPFRGVTGAFQSVWGLAQGNGEDQSVVAKQTGKRKRS